MHDEEGYFELFEDAPDFRKEHFKEKAKAILEAAAPQLMAERLLALAADTRARGDIGKEGGVEAWDYLTRSAELMRGAK